MSESEAWFQALFEGVETGIFVIDPETHTLVNANSVAAEMVGIPRQELLGSLCHKFVCPAEKGRCPVTDLGQTVDNSERVLTANGNRRAIIKTVRRVEVSGRSQLLESFVDITELKRTEALLRESEDRFRTAFEGAPYGMCMTAPSGRFMHANAALCSILGYSEQELLAGAWQEITYPEDLERSRQAGIQLNRPGATTLELEKRYIHKNGSVIWARAKISPANPTSSGPSYFITQIEDITQRRQADEAKAFLATLVESSPDAIVGKSLDGRILSWNRGAQELYGYTAKEMIGKPIALLVPPERMNEVQQGLRAAGRDGLVIRYETERVRKDGMHIEVALTLSPVRDVAGEITSIATIAYDITERRLREEQTHLQSAALNSTVNGMVICDRRGRILWVNPAFSQLTGYAAEEVVDKTPRLLKSGVQGEALYQHLWSTILHGDTWQGEMVNRRKDGSLYDEELTVTPVRSGDGAIHHFVAVMQDITERKRAQEALRENEERYRELFENASETIFTTDLEGRFTSMNLAAQQTFGCSQEEAAELDVWRVTVPESWQVLRDLGKAMLAGTVQRPSEIEVTAKNGRRVKLEIKPRLIRRGGETVGIQVIARDVTGRDLAEVELRQAQKLESVGRLASGIAHEINTPIQFVGDNTRFLQDAFHSLKAVFDKMRELRDAVSSGSVPAKLLEEVRRVEEESECTYLLEEAPRAIEQSLEGVDRIATIVRALKEFAHPEDTEMAPADLNKALISTITVARNEWKYVAEIETDFGELPSVVCNVGDLNQVFLNLLVNAAHAISDVVKSGEKGRISVRSAVEDGKIHISIADTGSGIPESIRGKIFDPFFTTKEVGRGTGQGLAIARSVVVDRHKGTLTFETEVTKGTTFHIYLPLSPERTATEIGGDSHVFQGWR